MGRSYTPRSDLRGRREFVTGLGARHPIVFDEKVDAFFWELDSRWAEVLPEREPGERVLTKLPERRFKVYDDPERMGVTVVESRLVARYAERRRNRVNVNDLGRTRLEIADLLGQLGTDEDMEVTFTKPFRVGISSDGKGNARPQTRGAKFAVVAEPACNPGDGISLGPDEALERDPYGLLVAEHDIIVDGIAGVFHNFRYPYDEFTPKLTVGQVYRDASPHQIDECEGILAELLEEQPLTVTLEPVDLFPTRAV